VSAILQRATFRTSRLLDFASRKELVAQTGHQVDEWPYVIVKELVDNAIDACEESETAAEISITIDQDGIEVADNGPGISTETVKAILDFTVRVSSREAYISPTRGAQGNALKTLVAMPFVLSGDQGCLQIEARASCTPSLWVSTTSGRRRRSGTTRCPVKIRAPASGST
jgi:Histidine kinase-, DNA gyrase B-, and HSP90-like ATPase